MGLRARLIQEVGTRFWLRVYWGDDCPNCSGSKTKGYHNAMRLLGEVPEIGAWGAKGKVEDYPNHLWPTLCSDCEAPVPGARTTVEAGAARGPNDIQRQVFSKRLYSTSSGNPGPGDLFFADWYHWDEGGANCLYWDDCKDRHLIAVLPNGHEWDTSSRASNCTLPEDRLHRCWVVHGTPPNVTVDKNGKTCAAGGGSIQGGNWHGFLRNGEFV